MRHHPNWLAVLVAAAAVTACGGSGSPDVMSSASTSRTHGVMTKTSATTIMVNGATFDISRATVLIDHDAATTAQLRSGMVARVRGSGDSSRARADEVEVENEVRGAVTAVSANTTPQFFNIGDVKVIINGSTIFDDLSPATFAAIQVGVFVEVDGMRDADGNIVATRVEGKGVRNPNAADVDELRGVITAVNLGASQFTLGTVMVSFTPTTTFTPPPRCTAASPAPGLRVEVRGAFTANNAFAATRVDCEDLEDDEAEAGENVSIEGFVTNLDATAHTFTINGQLVSFDASVEFKDGAAADLVNNAVVEVEGTMNGTTLVAHKIEFEHRD